MYLLNLLFMSLIKEIKALQILDSRGNPTVRVFVKTSSGAVGVAAVPSGASTGSHEAWELRDGGADFGGLGVTRAIQHIEGSIARALKGMSVTAQRKIDATMIALDGTDNKKKLGANAILGVSLACMRAAALEAKVPLYRYMRSTFDVTYDDWRLPLPTMNVINGGVHADSGLSTQEFMLIPTQKTFSKRLQAGTEIFHTLKTILKKRGDITAVGDEGGFAPHLGSSDKALQLLVEAIAKAGYIPGKDVYLGVDVAASEFFKKGKYLFEGTTKSPDQMVRMYERWIKKYPLISIEDPLAEDDWDNWALATTELQTIAGGRKKIALVGDDLFVTNRVRLEKGIDLGVANAVLIKVNQIGTLSETIDTIITAQEAGYKVSVSHRSGETGDTFIADLAVAMHADYLKSGSLSRSERVEKYNRMLEIEEELG